LSCCKIQHPQHSPPRKSVRQAVRSSFDSDGQQAEDIHNGVNAESERLADHRYNFLIIACDSNVFFSIILTNLSLPSTQAPDLIVKKTGSIKKINGFAVMH
jgi:hypothetical protein